MIYPLFWKKIQALVELVDIASPDSKMGALLNDTRTFSDLLKMIGANLFRALPFRPDSAADDDEEDEVRKIIFKFPPTFFD